MSGSSVRGVSFPRGALRLSEPNRRNAPHITLDPKPLSRRSFAAPQRRVRCGIDLRRGGVLRAFGSRRPAAGIQ